MTSWRRSRGKSEYRQGMTLITGIIPLLTSCCVHLCREERLAKLRQKLQRKS